MSITEAIIRLENFAKKHDVELIKKGSNAFNSAVGFVKENGGMTKSYVVYNPINMHSFEDIPEFYDEDLYDIAAEAAPDAYGKINCLSVIVKDEDYDEAIRQLDQWVQNLEKVGEVEIVEFNNGARGLQARFSGSTGHTLKINR